MMMMAVIIIIIIIMLSLNNCNINVLECRRSSKQKVTSVNSKKIRRGLEMFTYEDPYKCLTENQTQ